MSKKELEKIVSTVIKEVSNIRDALAGTWRGAEASNIVKRCLGTLGADFAEIPVHARYWISRGGELDLHGVGIEVELLPPFKASSFEGLAVPLSAADFNNVVVVVDARGKGCSFVNNWYRRLTTRWQPLAVLYVVNGPSRCPIYPDPLPPRAEDPLVPSLVAHGKGAVRLLHNLPAFVSIRADAELGYGYGSIYLVEPKSYINDEAAVYLVAGYDHWLEGSLSRVSGLAAALGGYILDDRGAFGLALLSASVYGEDLEWSLYWGAGARKLAEIMKVYNKASVFIGLEHLGLGDGLALRGSFLGKLVDYIGWSGPNDWFTATSWLRSSGLVLSMTSRNLEALNHAYTWRDSHIAVSREEVIDAAILVSKIMDELKRALTSEAIIKALEDLYRNTSLLPFPFIRREVYRLLRLAKRGVMNPLEAQIAAERAIMAPLYIEHGPYSSLCTLLEKECIGLVRDPYPGRVVYGERVIGNGGSTALRLLDKLVSEKLSISIDASMKDFFSNTSSSAPPD